MTLSQRSSVISASVLRSISDPALLTRTSSRPKRSSISPTIRPTSDACNLTPYPASRLRTAIMLGRSISLEIAASAPAFEAASSTSSPALPDGEGKELIAEIRQRQPEKPVAVGERKVEQGQDDLRAVHMPENELEGLRERRVVFYDQHPLHRDTSTPSSSWHTLRSQP